MRVNEGEVLRCEELTPLEKTLTLGKIEGRRRWLNGIMDSIDISLSKLREMVRTE